MHNGKAAYNGLEVIYDANTTLQPGIYICNGTKNTPSNYGFLTVKSAYNGLWIIQEFYHVGNGESPNIYKRSYVNSIWSDNWEQTATKDDLDKHFQSYNNYDYIFSKGTYPRTSIIRTPSGEVILRSSTDSSNYLQLRINNTGVYADWIENEAAAATKTIITKA